MVVSRPRTVKGLRLEAWVWILLTPSSAVLDRVWGLVVPKGSESSVYTFKTQPQKVAS